MRMGDNGHCGCIIRPNPTCWSAQGWIFVMTLYDSLEKKTVNSKTENNNMDHWAQKMAKQIGYDWTRVNIGQPFER